MGLRIGTNVQSLAAQRNLGINGDAQKASLEKLASGSRINRASDDAAGLAISEKIEGVKDAKEFEGATSIAPAIDPKRPRARPQVVKQQQVRPAILAENKFGTTNIGNIAVDARWSEYGAYLQRMIDTVQIQWERLILQQSANPAAFRPRRARTYRRRIEPRAAPHDA